MNIETTITLPDGSQTQIIREYGNTISVSHTSSYPNIVSVSTSATNSVSVSESQQNSVTVGSGVYQTVGEGNVWGSINGNIINQTDLVNYIDSEISAIPTPETPTLQSVTDAGNTTTNSIEVSKILVGDGSYATPAISFQSDTNTGLYRNAENELDIVAGGGRFRIDGTRAYGTIGGAFKINLTYGQASAPTYSFNGYDNNGMFRPMGINAVAFSTAGTEKLRITQDGNVGIGTTSPTEKLHVDGNIQANIFKTPANNMNLSGSYLYAGNIANTPFEIKTRIDSSDLVFGTGRYGSNIEAMRIVGGNVGIGTTAPTFGLDIHKSGDAFRVANDGGYDLFSVKTVTDQSSSYTTNTAGNSQIYSTFLSSYNYQSFSALYARGLKGQGANNAIGIRAVRAEHGVGYGAQGSLEYSIGIESKFNTLSTGVGSINNIYGFYNSAVNTGVTINNQYGLYLSDNPVATNNYGVYQAGTSFENIFEGNVTIGKSASGAESNSNALKLSYEDSTAVDGDLSITANPTGTSTNFVVTDTRNGELFRVNTNRIEWSGGDAQISRAGAANPYNFYGGSDINLYTGSTSWASITTESKPLYLGTTDKFSANLVIDTAGNVGIGTTAPTAKLHVVGTTSIIDSTLKLGNRTGSNGALILQGNNGPNFTIEGVNDTLDFSLVTGNPNGGVIQFSDAIKNVWFANSVGGTFAVRRANSANTDNNFGGIFVESQATTTSNGRAIYVSADNNGGIIRSTSYGGTGTTGLLQFQVGGNTSLPETKMVMDASGNVGIGTTSPASKLEVHQSADSQGLKIVGFDDENNSNLHLFVDNFGNDKIHSTEFLEISAGGSSRYRSTGYLRLEVGNTSNQMQLDYNYMKFTSGGTETMRITPGNVGIGTTSPAWKLHVNSTQRAGIFGFGTPWTSDGVLYIGAYYQTHTPLLVEHHSTSANSSSYFFAKFRNGDDEDVIKFRTNGSADFNGSLTVNSTNNLGRITVNPTNDSNDAIGIDERGFIAFADGGILTTRFRGLPGGGFQFQDDAYNTFFNLSKNGNSYLNTTSNFGIGTTAPTNKLHVNAGNVNQVATFESTDGNAHITLKDNAGALYLNRSSNKSSIGPVIGDSTSNITINDTGEVGIGTTTPTSKTHINGTALAQLRLEQQGGPTGNADTRGQVGDIAYDDQYFYVKTTNGWGRVLLDFAF